MSLPLLTSLSHALRKGSLWMTKDQTPRWMCRCGTVGTLTHTPPQASSQAVTRRPPWGILDTLHRDGSILCTDPKP